MAEFGATPRWPELIPENWVRRRLEAAGLRVVDLQHWAGKMRVKDVGALVYCLKAVARVVRGFSVELAFGRGLYLIEARQSS